MSRLHENNLVIVGDIAVPSPQHAEIFDRQLQKNSHVFKDKVIIGNLEGLIMDDYGMNDKKPILFNHSSVANVLNNWNFSYVGLANNHTLDRPQSFEKTVEWLKQKKIHYSGAGFNRQEANQPAMLEMGDRKLIIFNHCWHVMLQHQKNPSQNVHVAVIDEEFILNQVKAYRQKYPESIIIIYPHWNFDLEIYPFPLHRIWSKHLIDAGANMVVGGHSHCIQGGEKYKNGWIIYGIGNFFIPWYTFINGHISFPDFAKTELAIEWDFINEPMLHFFKYEPDNGNHLLNHLSAEPFTASSTLIQYTPYRDMSDDNYEKFFKKNRRKNKWVPVYYDYTSKFNNKVKDTILITRIRIARKLAQYNLRNWNN